MQGELLVGRSKGLGRGARGCLFRACLSLCGLILLWAILHLALRPRQPARPVIISHRGAAGLAPENTLVSVRRALDQGALLIEVDVQRSADGVLLLMHDKTVDRTTDGCGEVRQLSWEEICQLDAGSSFGSEFGGEPVARFDAVLEAVADTAAALVIEIKHSDLYPGIELELIQAIQEADMADRVIVASFDHDLLGRIGQIAPDLSLAYLYVFPVVTGHVPADAVVDVHWLGVVLDPTLVWRMGRQGNQVWAWTVNSVPLTRLLGWLGVAGITSDHPGLYSESLDVG